MAIYNDNVNYRLQVSRFLVVPMTLNHYTTIDALIGIINKKEIWFTNIEFLNDYTEFTNGKLLFLRCMEDFKDTFRSLDTFQSIKKYIEDEITPFDYFSFSVSEESDSLEQWRAYANSENGVMVSFMNLFTQSSDSGISCVKVEYDDQVYLDEISSFVKEMAHWEFDSSDKDLIYFWGSLSRILSIYFLKKKDKSYRNEREWKLFYSPDEIDDAMRQKEDPVKSDIRYRTSNGFVVPYSIVDIEKIKTYDPRQFVSSVIVSPFNRREQNEHSRALKGIERLLKDSKIWFHRDKIKFSVLPYR